MLLRGMRLSSTSALVLLWAGKEHLLGSLSAAWLDSLDLEDGRSLYEDCQAICPYYAEVIRNRKYGVRRFIADTLEKGEIKQVVIAGAGLDPLGIDLAECYPGVQIFELDRDNMDLKRDAYHRLSHHTKIYAPHFVSADLAEAQAVHVALRAQGWDPAEGTLLILEGISYYLTPEALRNLVHTLQPKRVICEYLKPATQIAVDRAAIPQQIFDWIARMCSLPTIQRYDATTLERLLVNLHLVQRMSMSRLERARTAKQDYFPTEESGWIEVSLLDRFQ
jgi:O-methyltransferase involved in polyketide biosynthesis